MNDTQPTGLQLAVALLAQIGDERSDAAIAAVHDLADEQAKRVTLQHHAADMAQQIEDLRFAAEAGGRRIAELEAALVGYHPFTDYMRELVDAGSLPGVTGEHFGDIAIRHMQNLAQQVADLTTAVFDLTAERNTARGAVRELERQVFALQQQRDVLQTCLDRHQRDEADPPGYLQDAVIRAAGLGALHTERDAAIKERDALRARLAEIEAQEPVAWDVPGFAVVNSLDQVPAKFLPPATTPTPLYARPVTAQAVPDGWRLVPVEPTVEMLGAATFVDDAAYVDGSQHGADVATIWEAMIAAAPEHKA